MLHILQNRLDLAIECDEKMPGYQGVARRILKIFARHIVHGHSEVLTEINAYGLLGIIDHIFIEIRGEIILGCMGEASTLR